MLQCVENSEVTLSISDRGMAKGKMLALLVVCDQTSIDVTCAETCLKFLLKCNICTGIND